MFVDSAGAVQTINQPVIQTPVQVNLDDPAANSLPGGWDYNNKPITMESVTNDPWSVPNYYSLISDRQLAIVVARISKRPYYAKRLVGIGTFTKDVALAEIEKRSIAGDLIISQELEWLDSYLENSKDK